MTKVERAALTWRKEYLDNNEDFDEVKREGAIGRNAFLAGATWQKEQDLKIAKVYVKETPVCNDECLARTACNDIYHDIKDNS